MSHSHLQRISGECVWTRLNVFAFAVIACRRWSLLLQRISGERERLPAKNSVVVSGLWWCCWFLLAASARENICRTRTSHSRRRPKSENMASSSFSVSAIVNRSFLCWCPALNLQNGVNNVNNVCYTCGKLVYILDLHKFRRGRCCCEHPLPNEFEFCYRCKNIIHEQDGSIPTEARIGITRAVEMYRLHTNIQAK